MTLVKVPAQSEPADSLILLLSVWRLELFLCQRHHVPADLQGKQLLRGSPCNQVSHIYPVLPEKQLHTPRLFKAAWDLFIFYLFISAFEDTPPSISPQLPLKHNRCLPTRLPSTSCLVTAGPLLSTTECLANSVSELNLEAPLIYPPSLD